MSRKRKIVRWTGFALTGYGFGFCLAIVATYAFDPRIVANAKEPTEILLLIAFMGIVISALARPKRFRAETRENKNG